MHEHLRIDHATVEPALHRDRFILGDVLAASTTRAGFDQRAAAVVLDDELVAEDLGHAALHGDRRWSSVILSIGPGCNSITLLGLPALREPAAAGAGRRAGREYGDQRAGADACGAKR